MKNLKKMLAILAASAVMCAAVPAFAEVELSKVAFDQDSAVTAFNFEYDEEDEVYKIGVEISTEVAIADEEMTFLVLDNDVTNDDILADNVDEEDILYIDQKTLKANDNTFEAAINLKLVNGAVTIVDDEEVVATEMPEGNYPVLVGYYYMQDDVKTFGRALATAVVTGGEEEEPVTITIRWGDVNGDTYLTLSDLFSVLRGINGTYDAYQMSDGVNECDVAIGTDVTVTDGTSNASVRWGDVNGDSYLTLSDLFSVLRGINGTYDACDIEGISTTVGSNIQLVVPTGAE